MRQLLPITAVLLVCPVVFIQAADMQTSTFVNKAGQIHMTEAHLGKLAQDRASAEDIKNFGRQLETDHKAAYQRLTQVAEGKGLTVPKAIDAEHQKTIDRMTNLSGERFDREFRRHQVQDHQKAIDFLRNAQQQLNDQQLKEYASALLPAFESHLQMARTLGTSQQGTQAAAHTGDVSQDRARQTGASDIPAGGTASTHHGTVTRYEAGKMLELKIRGRSGRHVYDLTTVRPAGEFPANLKTGSRVSVTESVDPNGLRTLNIQMDGKTTRARQAEHQQDSDK